MKKLMKEIKKELGVNSTKELKEKLIEEIEKLGLSKVDIIYYATREIFKVIVVSIVLAILLLSSYYVFKHDVFIDEIDFNIKTIIQFLVIFVVCFLFVSFLALFKIIDLVFRYRLGRGVASRFLKDLKEYNVPKDLLKDFMKNSHETSKT
jgi:ABC-type multidrug transport system fused ATPase/permease subunit